MKFDDIINNSYQQLIAEVTDNQTDPSKIAPSITGSTTGSTQQTTQATNQPAQTASNPDDEAEQILKFALQADPNKLNQMGINLQQQKGPDLIKALQAAMQQSAAPANPTVVEPQTPYGTTAGGNNPYKR